MPVSYSKLSSGPDTRRARQVSLSSAPAYGGYEGWTKAELQEELEKRDLSKTGNKDELIARLEEDDG